MISEFKTQKLKLSKMKYKEEIKKKMKMKRQQ